MTGYKKCVCCESRISYPKTEDFYYNGTYTDTGDPIHQTCLNDDESESIATVKPLNKATWDLFSEYNGYDLEVLSIGNYHNQTDKIFFCGYSSSSQWRGYYQPTSDKFKEVWENHITMGYGNEDQLKEFDREFNAFCEANNIRSCRVISRTSNCLSSGLGYWVYNEDLEKYNKLLEDPNNTKIKELLAN